MYLKTYLSWKMSSKKHFFDDVHVVSSENEDIEDPKLKANIMNWIIKLKHKKNITINKFSDLFDNFEGIIFPITVSGYPRYLKLKDKLGRRYYFEYSNMYDLGKYSIGRREYPYDKEFVYFLNPEKEIVLQKLYIGQLDKDELNTGNSLTFSYDMQTNETTVALDTLTMSLEITYPSLDIMKDLAFSEQLFVLANTIPHFYDVSPILILISNLLDNIEKNFSATIVSYMKNTDYTQDLLSEIHVFDGFVTQYSFTQKNSNTFISHNLLHQDVEDFILSHKQ